MEGLSVSSRGTVEGGTTLAKMNYFVYILMKPKNNFLGTFVFGFKTRKVAQEAKFLIHLKQITVATINSLSLSYVCRWSTRKTK